VYYKPLLQFSFQPPSSYAPESALTVLETLKTIGHTASGIAKRPVTGSKEDVNLDHELDHEK